MTTPEHEVAGETAESDIRDDTAEPTTPRPTPSESGHSTAGSQTERNRQDESPS